MQLARFDERQTNKPGKTKQKLVKTGEDFGRTKPEYQVKYGRTSQSVFRGVPGLCEAFLFIPQIFVLIIINTILKNAPEEISVKSLI